MLTASALTVKILGVIYKIPLSYVLTDEGMGYFNTAYTIFSSFYIICTAGVPKAVSILVSKCRAEGDEKNALCVFKTARLTFSLLGLLCGIMLVFLRAPISHLLANENAAPSLFSIAFSLVFISIAGAYKGYLNGHGKHIPIALAEVTEAMFKLILGLLFAYAAHKNGASYEYISAYTVCGISLGAVASAFILFIGAKTIKCGNKSEQNMRTASFKKETLKKILEISIPVAITALVLSATSLIDLTWIMRRLVESGYTDYEANNLYGNYTTLATPFLNFTIAIVSPISAAALPRLCRAYSAGKIRDLIGEGGNVISLSLFFSVPLSVGFIFFSNEILSLIFTKEAAIIAAPHLTLLAPAFTVAAVLICTNTILEATGHTAAPLLCMSCAALFKIVSTYCLVGNNRFGISGASIGTVIFYTAALIFSTSYLRKSSGRCIAIFAPFLTYLLPSVFAAFCAKALLSYLRYAGKPEVITTVISAFLYGIVYLLMVKIYEGTRLLKCKMSNMHKKRECVLYKEPIV